MSEGNSNKKSGFGKTWIVVAAIVAITGVLLIFSINSKYSLYNNSTSSVQTEKDTAHTTLDFSPPRISSPSGTYETDININSGSNKVTLAQLEMSYNPKQLTRVDIRPADFIINSMVIQKSIDPANGRIKFWIGVPENQPGVSGSGSLATISFIKVGSGSAKITFLPKTSVRADGIDQSVLKNVSAGVINILPKPTKSYVNPNRFTLPTRVLSPTQIQIQKVSPAPTN